MSTTIETSAFDIPGASIDAGTLRCERSDRRTVFTFAAPAVRHHDGGLELNSVNAWLADRSGRFVARRGSEWSRPALLTNRATWAHEFPDDQVAQAASLVYEIDLRVEYRRQILAGELHELPAESDASDWWRWLEPDPRQLEDRSVRFDFAIWARATSLDVTLVQHPLVACESLRTELELDVMDGDGQSMWARNFTIYSNAGNHGFTDGSQSMDRRTMRSLRLFRLTGRTEVRSQTRSPAIAITALRAAAV